MSNTPAFNAEQLAAARSRSWHQAGDPILTLDAARDFITSAGLVLFTPRTQQLPVPAPSFVEATLGAPAPEPAAAQLAAARSLVSRLVAEGNALPLNLLGAAVETPDFIVSAQVFSFLYTLRGDKAWKQPPAATGVAKASPLGIRIFEVLTEKGALTAAELAGELGRELTESAIQRALTELWSNLRVLPLYPQDADAPTLWELTTRRFTKAIKAGINAGQPTALSALISLYLAQSLLASEDEIEVFLSPLAARSRIREVAHALRDSRQLEIIVLDGKSLLHIPGTLPEFPAAEAPAADPEAAAEEAPAQLEGDGRIKRFTSTRSASSDFKGKPARTFGDRARFDKKPTFGADRSAGDRKPRFAAKPDRERRPFNRSNDAAEKPAFTRPWDEDRKPRSPRAEGDQTPRRPYKPRESSSSGFWTPRPGASSSGRPARPYKSRTEGTGDKPFRKFDAPRKPFTRREEADPAARPYKPRESRSSGPWTPRSGTSSAGRPAGPSFGAKRPYKSREEGTGDKPFRKFDAPRKPFTPRAGGRPDKPAYGGSNSKPRAPKAPKDAASLDSAARPWTPKTGRSDGRPGGPGSKPRAPRKDFGESRSSGPRGKSSFGGPKSSFGKKPSFGKKSAFGKKPGGFSKASGDTVPFGSKPPRGVNPRTFDKPTPRRGTPGVKAPFPRKPRPESEE